MTAESFGDLLRSRRAAAGLTQEALAVRSGLSVRGISDLERGVKRRPQRDTLRMLASALELSPSEIARFATAATPASPVLANKLPQPLTPLIGRDTDVADLFAWLSPGGEPRLVTLTGSGGVGKTRLALRVAADLRAAYPDGVVFVPLADLDDHRLVPDAVGKALGLKSAGRPMLDEIRAHLRPRRLLLLLDNLEHLLPIAAELVALLGACPRLAILATSRAPLHVAGEHEFPVTPLALPGAGPLPPLTDLARVPAVELFVQQVHAHQPAFVLTDTNAPAVVAICTLLDGLPLAIELAAVRMKTITPEMLEGLLSDRLGLLTHGSRDAPARQRTMRDTITWSHQLLSSEEQGVFRELSAFVGGATLPAMAAVIADEDILVALDRLTALIDQSLVQRGGGQDTDPRFAMLETIRAFALERLAESADETDVRDRHAAYYLAMAEQGETELSGPRQVAWMARLEAEYGNLRAAFGWSLERRDASTALRLGGALWQFWATSGRLEEGKTWLEKSLAIGSDAAPEARAKALLRLGNLAIDLAEYPRAHDLYKASLAIYQAIDDEPGAAGALNGVGLVKWNQGDYSGAREAFQDALVLWQAHGRNRGFALTLQNLGHVAVAEGNYEEASKYYEESLQIRRNSSDSDGTAYSLFYVSQLERLQQRLAEARGRLDQSLVMFRHVGDRLGVAYVHYELGWHAFIKGDPHDALNHYRHAISVRQQAGDSQGTVDGLEGIAAVACSTGQEALGVALIAATTAWRVARKAMLPPPHREILDHSLESASRILTEHAYQHAWQIGLSTGGLDSAMEMATTVKDSP